MANNNFFQILLEAILDENASASKIKQQVDNLSKKAGTLKLGTSLDEKEIQRLRSEIAQIQKELANENLTTKQRSALLTELNQKQRTLNAESRAYNQQEKADLANQRNALSQIAAAQKDVVSIKRSQSQLNKMEKAEEEKTNAAIRDRVSLLSNMKTWRSKQTDGTMLKTGLFGDDTGNIKSAQTAYENLYASIQNGEISIKDARVQFQLLRDELTQLSTLSSKSAKIEMAVVDDTYSARVDTLIGKTMQWTDANGNARISTTNLQSALNTLNTAYANITATGGNTEANQRALIEAERALDVEVKKVTNSVNSMNSTMMKSSAVDGLRQKVQQFYDTNTATHGKWGKQLQSIMAQLGSGMEVPIAKGRQLEQEFIGIQNAARQAGKLGQSWFDKLKSGMSAFSVWTSATFLVMKGVQITRDMIQNVREFDDSLLELSKVSDLSAEGLAKVTDEAYKLGERVGRTGKQVVDAVTEFKRAGYSMENSMGMAEAALVMTNVAEGIDDTADAAGTLISVLKGYDMAESEVMSIVDKINQVSNTSPIGFDQIAEGLERTSGTLAQSGTTIDETIGLITAGFAQLRNVEKVSTGLITLSARIRGVDEDGEVIDGLSATLQTEFGKIGVAIEDADGNLRSIYDIMQDYSKVLPTLTSKQKQYYAELAAGCSMINRVSSNVQKCA